MKWSNIQESASEALSLWKSSHIVWVKSSPAGFLPNLFFTPSKLLLTESLPKSVRNWVNWNALLQRWSDKLSLSVCVGGEPGGGGETVYEGHVVLFSKYSQSYWLAISWMKYVCLKVVINNFISLWYLSHIFSCFDLLSSLQVRTLPLTSSYLCYQRHQP